MIQEMKPGMTATERRATIGLAGVYGVRMLGLFLILPVFALFAEHLPGATPLLTGLAIGVYGLSQALLQIPFGVVSDRIGRKPVIFTGLLIFALGSVLAATATDIWGVIIGRAVQGSGAIAAVVMALAADLTREEQRTKVMAIIGMTIGVSFMLAMIAGPTLDHWFGVSGIFWLTAALALIAIAIVALVVPQPIHSHLHRDAQPVPAMFRRVLSNPDLLRLNFGIFCLHMILTASFLVVPLALRDAGLEPARHALLYLPVMVLSIAFMIPFVILAEKHGRMKQVFLGAILVAALAELVLSASLGRFWGLAIGLTIFFTAFNLLEATLPSLVSKTAPADAKGTAMGVYSTAQFAGAFVGGVIGGWVHNHWGLDGVLLAAVVVAAAWLLVAQGMRQPGQYVTRLLALPGIDKATAAAVANRLAAVTGVVEAVVVVEEGVAYLKIEKAHLDDAALEQALASTS